MERKYVIIAGISLAVAFAFGRYSAPEKVRTETKIVEVEKKTENTKSDSDLSKHRETIVTEITRPDGTKEKTTRIIEDSQKNKKTDSTKTDDRTSQETDSKEISTSSQKTNVSLMYGVNYLNTSIVYGARISRPVLGPISIGLWGLNNGTIGAEAGINF